MSEYRHLDFTRISVANERRRGTGFPRIQPPDNPGQHGQKLRQELDDTRTTTPYGGYDDRRLLKLTIDKNLQMDNLASFGELEVISQEQDTVVVLFAAETALNEFRSRLELVQRGEHATRQDILFAIKGIDGWTSEDRMGQGLMDTLPADEPFKLDVELWSLESPQESDRMRMHFEEELQGAGIQVLDQVRRPVPLYRVLSSRGGLDLLLRLRDVRRVHAPPQFYLAEGFLYQGVPDLPVVDAPEPTASSIVVLDSGVAAGHPLLSPALGDAQNFIPDTSAEDVDGHGTAVAGIALHGDLEQALTEDRIQAETTVFSGKIIQGNHNDEKLLESQITAAVEYFATNYHCRVFNISIGIINKPYSEGHMPSLAATLDWLAHKYQVLFVVSAGNLLSSDLRNVDDIYHRYPDYLLDLAHRIIDPAPALNVLTVGSIAKFEVSRQGVRHPQDPTYQPLARRGQPSPFTRSGPGFNDAIKPEVVEYGGNVFLDIRGQQSVGLPDELGELSLSRNFVSGRLFQTFSGTSFAAPKVAHLAAQLLNLYPSASHNLLRALIVAHARVPEASRTLLQDSQQLRNLVGYGRPDPDAARYSTDDAVTLISEDVLPADRHHFFEIPVPEEFWTGKSRPRQITVALSHTPWTRASRISYRYSTLEFRVVSGSSLTEVESVFRYTSQLDRQPIISEVGHFQPSSHVRKPGTVQAATWRLQRPALDWVDKKLFIVITHTPRPWAQHLVEPESYALVVVLEDMANDRAQLYGSIQQLLQVRARIRG